MKFNDPDPFNPDKPAIESEGKILEFMPVIYSPMGELFTLPPIQWKVPNKLLGLAPNHIFGFPYNFQFNERHNLPGHMGSSISGYFRILEHQPDAQPNLDAVNEFVIALGMSEDETPKT